MQLWIDSFDISGVARYDGLPRPSGADDYVGVGDIRGCRLPQQETDGCSVGSVERDQVRALLPDQAGKACLPRWVADRLGERRRRDDYGYPEFHCPRQQNDDAPIVSIERDQSTRVEGDASHAALLVRFFAGA